MTAPTTTENHLRLLSIFHYVLAALGALLSLLPVVLAEREARAA